MEPFNKRELTEKHLRSEIEARDILISNQTSQIEKHVEISNRSVQANFVDKVINWLSPVRGFRRMTARNMLKATAYRAAEITRLRDNWIIPGQYGEVDPVELSYLRERSRDANRNDPIASGATDTIRENVVGNGLKPQSKLRADILGLSESQGTALQVQAEDAWKRFGRMADAANRLDIDEIQFLVLTKIIEDGESLVIPTWADESWRPFGRCLEVLESERLSTPFGDNDNVVDGIKLGGRGQPMKYFISKVNSATEHVGVNAYDSEGRPKIFHLYRQRRPGQVRGIPLFAPVLTYFKDLADYMEAEITSARVAACLSVFVTKADPTGVLLANSTLDTAGDRIQGVEPGMVGYLGVGESINVVDPKRDGESFSSFTENILRMIGASLGLPYELLMKDFSKTNYSSARAALLEGRRMFTGWRSWFAKKFCQPIWELVLEEAYLRGEFEAPKFYENKLEYCRASWIGGAWGWVDPVKEVEASRKAVDYGFSTLADEVAAQGKDWDEVLEQRKREKIREDAIGILSTASNTQKQGGQSDAEAE
ncbi:MAG: phage portal protein [Deltaproteobacteria bacterium]|nr:phage portal protein [Deltaproteobacteria bacterium]